MFPVFLSQDLLEQIARWPELKRWERREIGMELRSMGLSFREIAAIIPVTKGTLSGWCADITLSPSHLQRLQEKRPDIATRSRVGAERRIRARRERQVIRSRAHEEGRLLANDPSWVAGVVAHWAEGSKGKELQFANSDPELVKLFIRWATRYFDLTADRYTIALHLHDGQDERERKQFWSWQTGIPLNQFRKTFIKPEGSGHRKNVLYAGTASVRVRRSGRALHRLLGWIDSLCAADENVG